MIIIGILVGVLIGSHTANSSATEETIKSLTVNKKNSSSQSESTDQWGGKDIEKSGTGVYPGMDKQQACQKAGAEAAYWLIAGTGTQRNKELYKRFYIPNIPEHVKLDSTAHSTAHWINHSNPPFTAEYYDTSTLVSTEGPDTAGCTVSIDGASHVAGHVYHPNTQQTDSGSLDFTLQRKNENSGWYVVSMYYSNSDYQEDIKTQGND